MLNPVLLERLFQTLKKEAEAPTHVTELVYLFGQTPENQSSTLDIAKQFEGPVGINGFNLPYAGYPGFDVWKKALIDRGTDAGRIVGMDGFEGTMSNTLTEARALVRYAKKQQTSDITIVAPYWHLLRCFMTTVGIALKEYPLLKIHPLFGVMLPWNERATHSQGIVAGIRADFMFTETIRLFQYNEKGDLPSAEEVLSYIESRGS